jgi:hypothetical protein
MNFAQKIFFCSAILASCISISACSGGADQAPKEIAPGQFVVDEPIQTAVGAPDKSSKCFVDSINGKPPSKDQTWEIHHGDEAVISGWGFRKDGQQLTPQLFIRLTGDAQTYYAVTTTRHLRADVNDHFHLDPSLMAGYELRAKTAQIEPGVYAITIMQAAATDVEGCESPTMLIVN